MSEEGTRPNTSVGIFGRVKEVILKFRELILYGVIGCVSSSIDFLIFTLLTRLAFFYVIANIISVVAGIVTSFTLNRKYNFKVKDNTFRRFAIFLSVGLMGLALSTLILWMLMEKIGMNEITSKIISIFGVVIFQFILNKYVTFRKKPKAIQTKP